jgi:hypothetical protein
MQLISSTVVGMLIGAFIMGMLCLWLVYTVTKKKRGTTIICHVCGQKMPANADMSDYMLSANDGVLYAHSRKPWWLRREETSSTIPNVSLLPKAASK